MRHIYVDRMDDGRISVQVAAGISKAKPKVFEDRDTAIRFAEARIGRTGVVVDTTLMSPEQLAAHRAREARAAVVIEQITRETKG
jgi:hypothetical protein